MPGRRATGRRPNDGRTAIAEGTAYAKEVDRNADRLAQAVNPDDARKGTLAPRNRSAATRALESLAITAESELGDVAFSASFSVYTEALTALAQTHAIAVRTVAEAGGAARAAAARNATIQPPSSHHNSAADAKEPKASSAAAWVEPLQHISTILETFLSSSELYSDTYEGKAAALVDSNTRNEAFKLLAALLHSDALPALSRLLAAEEHRGTAAVLDTDALYHALHPLFTMLDLARAWPQQPLPPYIPQGHQQQHRQRDQQQNQPQYQQQHQAQQQDPQQQQQQHEKQQEDHHQQQQQQQQHQQHQRLGPAVLRALADSGVVEHVCRFAVRHLPAGLALRAGQQEEKGVRERRAQWQRLHAFIGAVCCLAQVGTGGGSAADAEAVLAAPSLRYLLHLHVVSQLHAVDGGTTYGLSYDKLLPVAPACPFGVGGEERSPMELSCDGLWTALTVWRMDMVSERTWRCPVLPLAAPNVSVTLLLRMARVALDSWKREHHRASHRRGLRGSSQTRPTPAAVLHPASCLDVALSALRRARDTVAAWPASVCDGTGRRGSGGSGGNGGSGASGPLGVRYGSGGGDLGGGGGNSSSGSGADPRVTASGGGGGSGDSNGRSEGVAAKDNGSSALSADGGGTGEGVERGAARAGGGGGVAGSREGVWLSSAQPRQFAGTWWTLVVEAVHAQLEDRTIKSDKTVFTDAVRMLLLLRLEWVRPQPPPAAATASGFGPSRPPRTWLSDAIAAGYIPCLEAFTREMMLPTSRDSGPLASRVPALLELLQGLWLRVLAACGEERQAAALLVTAIKATAVLAGQDATRRRALQTFADIPGALAGAAVDWAGVTGAEAQTNPGRLGGSPDGPDSPADDGDGAESSKQPVAPHQPARLLSLCLARWLPLCSKLLPQERDDIDTAARSGLLAAGRRMVRLAGLAQAAAEGRGDARAAESWGRLLGACGSMGEGEQQAEGEEGAAPPPAGDGDGDGSRAAGDAERGFPALAALLVAPCDVGREVLPTCSNPLCMKPLTASEAYVKLCPCKGKCGGTACSGKGPCCCHLCAKKAEWRGCM